LTCSLTFSDWYRCWKKTILIIIPKRNTIHIVYTVNIRLIRLDVVSCIILLSGRINTKVTQRWL
jgi:hypothetical protein